MDTTEIERVAASLTDAQRQMIQALANGQPREFALGMVGFALMRRNLVFVNDLGARHLTDLGHAVRNHLEAQ